MKNQSDWEILLSLEGIIFNLDKISVDQSVKSIINKFDHDYPESFNNIVAHMVYENLVIKMNNADTYFDFLNKIEMFEERNNIKSKILKVFTHILQNKNTKEAYFLFDYMIEHNILELKKFKFIGPVQEPYFVHYLSKEEIKNKEQYLKANFSKYDELSKNDWALHKKLIKEGVNPSELAKIIRNDDLEKLQEISSQNDFNFDQCIIPSLYERCSFINCLVSLIDYAAFFGSIKCFKYLLLNGAKVNNTGKYAIAGGNLEIIHLCVQNHSSFKDAYETAIEFHRNDVFHYIYENKMVIIQNIEELGKKCTLYHNYEILSYLIEKGLKILDFFVFYVAQNYNLYLTRYLLENKNKVNVMFFTAKAGNYEIMKYFIEQEKMDITVKNYDGDTVLILACQSGNSKTVKLILGQNVIDINAKNNGGNTALILAAQNENRKIVKILLEQNGIKFNEKNICGRTALIYASENGHTEIVKLLLEQEEIDINAKNNYGVTALIIASDKGHTDIVKILLEQEGIETNVKDFYYGNTALMWASRRGHTEIVKLLLEQKGIDVNAKNKDGETAIILAAKNGHTEIVKIYQEKKRLHLI